VRIEPAATRLGQPSELPRLPPVGGQMSRYYVTVEGLPEAEVSKEEYIQFELKAGVRLAEWGDMDKPRTLAFSQGAYTGRVVKE
jgi:hypothetical protein